jgi:phosphoribosyl 1,2-cyclic phosphodiesterase
MMSSASDIGPRLPVAARAYRTIFATPFQRVSGEAIAGGDPPLPGTGASGGTPGRARSRRLESSLLVRDGEMTVLLDVTRDFGRQAARLEPELTAVLLTHAHRDACGGIARLHRWWSKRPRPPIPVLASAATISALRRRFARLDHCRFVPVTAGCPEQLGALRATPIEVPHAREAWCPTFAWRLEGARTIVYASDLAALTPDLRAACAGATALIIDGAMWGRRLFSHLTIDAELERLCAWPPRQILLTQIGRTAPRHERLEREVARRCPRARPAYDGLELTV